MNGGSAGSAHIVAGNSGKKKASRRGGNFFCLLQRLADGVGLFKNKRRGRIVELAVLEVDGFGGEAFQQSVRSAFFKVDEVVLVDISVLDDNQQVGGNVGSVLRHLAAIQGNIGDDFQLADGLLVFIVQHTAVNILVQGAYQS